MHYLSMIYFTISMLCLCTNNKHQICKYPSNHKKLPLGEIKELVETGIARNRPTNKRTAVHCMYIVIVVQLTSELTLATAR